MLCPTRTESQGEHVTARRGNTEERDRELSFGHVLSHVERQVARRLEAALAGDLLSDGEGHPMSEIAATIVVPGPTLTKLIDKLVDAAVVYRLVDARDRRRVLAFLSDSGRVVYDRLAPAVGTTEARALDALGADGSLLLALLSRLGESLAEA